MKTRLTLLFSSAITLASLNAQEITISENVGSGDVYWTSENTYLLDGGVYVNDATTLHIAPGTIIKGMSGQTESASFLCVAKGGKIIAEGTEESPIIFTFEADPLDGSTPLTTRGQWGGLIVLGNASLNSTPGFSSIEGIPTSETRGQYGGDNDSDNSGVLRYISIRHGGTEIGAGNEINGLTLGGVGSETIIDNVEVIANNDDGIEFFGGTVSVTHAFVSACGDDSFDYDEGWRGQLNSHWVAIAASDDGDRGGEHDGGTDPETAQPYATPIIDSAIFIGRGVDAGKRAITFRDNAGGHYSNSIFYNFAKGIDIEDLEGETEDSYSRFLNDELTFTNNIVDCGSNIFVTSTGEDLSEYFELNGNQSTTDHGLVWHENEVYMNNNSNWANWTLAVESGWVKIGNQDVSISETEKVASVIYPNPIVNNSINISFKEPQKGACSISNSLGQITQYILIDGNHFKINNLIEPGIYFLKIELNSGQIINEVLIK